MKGMVFSTKLVMQHVLTWFVVRENFRFKTEHSDSKRLMVSCEDESCPWLVHVRETMSGRSQNAKAPTCATKFRMFMMVRCLIRRS